MQPELHHLHEEHEEQRTSAALCQTPFKSENAANSVSHETKIIA